MAWVTEHTQRQERRRRLQQRQQQRRQRLPLEIEVSLQSRAAKWNSSKTLECAKPCVLDWEGNMSVIIIKVTGHPAVSAGPAPVHFIKAHWNTPVFQPKVLAARAATKHYIRLHFHVYYARLPSHLTLWPSCHYTSFPTMSYSQAIHWFLPSVSHKSSACQSIKKSPGKFILRRRLYLACFLSLCGRYWMFSWFIELVGIWLRRAPLKQWLV